jgi:hypothetical protein
MKTKQILTKTLCAKTFKKSTMKWKTLKALLIAKKVVHLKSEYFYNKVNFQIYKKVYTY